MAAPVKKGVQWGVPEDVVEDEDSDEEQTSSKTVQKLSSRKTLNTDHFKSVMAKQKNGENVDVDPFGQKMPAHCKVCLLHLFVMFVPLMCL